VCTLSKNTIISDFGSERDLNVSKIDCKHKNAGHASTDGKPDVTGLMLSHLPNIDSRNKRSVISLLNAARHANQQSSSNYQV